MGSLFFCWIYGHIQLRKSSCISASLNFCITDTSLTNIENEIKVLLLQHNLTLLDKEFASKQLPDEVIEAMRHENHNDGNQYLQGIFQKTD